jgi:crotonobetainyl-CoA:carnitine CoA-transferase CaiB-like acyl-CoA transferase
VIDLAIYETLLTLLGPQVVNYDQLGLVQQRSGSRLPFTAPRNTYRTKDGQYVAIAGSAQSTFVRICAALGVPDLVEDPRFATNRARLVNATLLDEHLQAAIERFDRDDLLSTFIEIGATAAPVNTVADIVDDPHVQARENIVSLDDPELGGRLRMQNVVGKFSRTPGEIAAPGPRLGEHNRAVLIGQLGYTEAELAAAGIALDGPAPAAEAAP